MIGAIIGDIAGAPYEGNKLIQNKRDYRPFFLGELAKFTDDTNLTIAVAESILTKTPYHINFIKWYNKNPNVGYGSSFIKWVKEGGTTQNDSWANGAVMRISPIALFAMKMKGDLNTRLEWAYKEVADSTRMTHNTEEARNGALAAITAMILAGQRPNYSIKEIKEIVSKLSGYDLNTPLDTIKTDWAKRDIRCNITVPQALICFFESTDFESAIKNSIYSEGDADTIAAIAGAIAEYYYGTDSINMGILQETKLRLQPEMIDIINVCYDGDLKW